MLSSVFRAARRLPAAASFSLFSTSSLASSSNPSAHQKLVMAVKENVEVCFSLCDVSAPRLGLTAPGAEHHREQEDRDLLKDMVSVLHAGEEPLQERLRGRGDGDCRVRLTPAGSWGLTHRSCCRLDQLDEGSEIQEYLREKTGQRSVPNIFISA
jgi:hypothetical protein